MAFLSKEAILKADDLRIEDVHIPEWDDFVDDGKAIIRLKTLTGQQRDEFEASLVKIRGNKQEQNLSNMRARLIALCAIEVNPDGTNGKRMFQSSGDVIDLGNKSAGALQRLFNKCNEMNGLSETDVEELTEGFDGDPSEGSTSD